MFTTKQYGSMKVNIRKHIPKYVCEMWNKSDRVLTTTPKSTATSKHSETCLNRISMWPT